MLLEEGFPHLEKGIILSTDSTAASGTAHRWGAGRIKHLELRQLWIQQYVSTGKLKVHKVRRAANPSDTLTHAYGPDVVEQFRFAFGQPAPTGAVWGVDVCDVCSLYRSYPRHMAIVFSSPIVDILT